MRNMMTSGLAAAICVGLVAATGVAVAATDHAGRPAVQSAPAKVGSAKAGSAKVGSIVYYAIGRPDSVIPGSATPIEKLKLPKGIYSVDFTADLLETGAAGSADCQTRYAGKVGPFHQVSLQEDNFGEISGTEVDRLPHGGTLTLACDSGGNTSYDNVGAVTLRAIPVSKVSR